MTTDIQSLGRFPGIAARDLTPDQLSALTVLMDERNGAVPAPYRYLIQSPGVVENLARTSGWLRSNGKLTLRQIEIVVLVTAQVMNTPFVKAAHRRIGEQAGLPVAAIDAILDGRRPHLRDPEEALIHDIAVQLNRPGPVDADLAAEAEGRIGAERLSNVILLIGIYAITCVTMRLTDARPG